MIKLQVVNYLPFLCGCSAVVFVLLVSDLSFFQSPPNVCTYYSKFVRVAEWSPVRKGLLARLTVLSVTSLIVNLVIHQDNMSV